ncbi:MAG TPA: hypothetical protein VFD17_01355 [Clostridia bacterium]|nr:hypothetical protein [Clostridia bacterium]
MKKFIFITESVIGGSIMTLMILMNIILFGKIGILHYWISGVATLIIETKITNLIYKGENKHEGNSKHL